MLTIESTQITFKCKGLWSKQERIPRCVAFEAEKIVRARYCHRYRFDGTGNSP